MSSTPGVTRTIAAGDTLRAEPLIVAGELNLDGEADIAPAALSAAGAAVGEGRRALTIAAGETLTVGARRTRKGDPVTVAGELNLTGELAVAPGGAALDAERGLAGSGTATGTGTGRADTELALAAAGVATAAGTASLSGSRAIAASGVATATGTAALDTARTLAASGTATGTGTAAPDAERALAAAGLATATGRALLSAGEPMTRYESSSIAWQEDEAIDLDADANPSE